MPIQPLLSSQPLDDAPIPLQSQALTESSSCPILPDRLQNALGLPTDLRDAQFAISKGTHPPDDNGGHPNGVLHGLTYSKEMNAAAKTYGIDPILLAAVAAQESGGGGIQAHNVDQPNGLGRGPFQIDVGAWPDKASIAHDPAKSANFAASLLKDGFRQADLAGDAKTPNERTKEALRTYNASSPHAKTTTTQWPDGKIPYEDSVLRRYQQIKAYLAASPSAR